MNFNSFEEIMEYAVNKEIEAAEFYEELSRQEPNPSYQIPVILFRTHFQQNPDITRMLLRNGII